MTQPGIATLTYGTGAVTATAGKLTIYSANGTTLRVLNDASKDYAVNEYHIETQTLGVAGTFTFTPPAGFAHILIRGMLRSSYAATNEWVAVRLNSDSGNNYNTSLFAASGSGTISGGHLASQAQFQAGYVDGNTALSGAFTAWSMLLYNYASTTATKMMVSVDSVAFCDGSTVSTFNTQRNVGQWKKSPIAAVTSVYIYGGDTANWVAGSYLSMIGLVG